MNKDLSYLTSIRRTDGLVALGERSIIKIEEVGTVISTAVVNVIQKNFLSAMCLTSQF